MSHKIEVGLTLGEAQQINDKFFIPIIVSFNNTKKVLTKIEKVIAKDTGKVLGYRLDGDHFSSTETLLKRLVSRLSICLNDDTDS